MANQLGKVYICGKCGSQVIVTGDKHLLALGNFRGIEVMTVSEFLRRNRNR